MLLNGRMINLTEAYQAFGLSKEEKPSIEFHYGLDLRIESLPAFEPWSERDVPLSEKQYDLISQMLERVLSTRNVPEWKEFVKKLNRRQASLMIQYLKTLDTKPTPNQISTVKAYAEHPWQAYREAIGKMDIENATRNEVSDLIGRLKKMEREHDPLSREQYKEICKLYKEACSDKYNNVCRENGKLTKRCLAELSRKDAESVIRMYREFIEVNKRYERKLSWLEESQRAYEETIREAEEARSSRESFYDGFSGIIGGIEGADGEFVW